MYLLQSVSWPSLYIGSELEGRPEVQPDIIEPIERLNSFEQLDSVVPEVEEERENEMLEG